MDSALQGVLSAAASFLAVTMIFFVIFVLCKERKRRDLPALAQTRTVPNSELSSITVSESALFDPSLNRLSMPELIKATRNFSPDLIIGDGSFGLVFKARLSSGVTVAVKKLSADAFQGFREFQAEMETLSKIDHPNIVTILGYCSTGSDRVLIYELIENGSLDQWLLDTSSSVPRLPLSWEARLKITRGVAKGLAYMHGLETPIVHRDIKASNVLLDSEFEPHIADFGLARRIEGSHSHVSTQVAGTMGYMPPEYFYGSTAATVSGDVYSFGILMLEIGTGLRPNLPLGAEEAGGKEVRLVDWARKMVAQDRQLGMLDQGVLRDGLKEAAVVEFFRIACLCASETSRDRPEMKEVVDLLSKIPS
ncbi:leucine-rich repeat receptor protein kinase EMS1 [Diospyros lotus]|uniref:leucine-rich repeat receptor protein kinase EMS1 n=1 Tax=Diospyros lotus TaxID=55363 RepID=UPI00225B90E4|nr:leucine-rich repeat receptor protein kinase EMS1 [Diospyros lotus]